jgi:hypothetical protein
VCALVERIPRTLVITGHGGVFATGPKASPLAAAPSWPTPATSGWQVRRRTSATRSQRWASSRRPARARPADLVGTSVAKQVLLGGYRINATTVERIALVSELVPSEECLTRANRPIDRMLKSSALALGLTKAVADARDAHRLFDDLAQAVLFDSQERYERMTRFLEGQRK